MDKNTVNNQPQPRQPRSLTEEERQHPVIVWWYTLTKAQRREFAPILLAAGRNAEPPKEAA